MNERIQQLAEQAGLIAGEHDDLDFKKNLTDKEKKFAELIVLECAQKGFNVFDEEPDAPASDLQYYVRDGIKEHFGVEE